MDEIEKKIVDNYSVFGPKKCSEVYGLSYEKVLWLREKHGLSMNKKSRLKLLSESVKKGWVYREVIHKVDENQFISSFNKESSYLLGFIWGDGYICDSGTNNQIRIECLSYDMEHIIPIFNKTGEWTINKRVRINEINNKLKKEVTIVSTSNKNLVNFLKSVDYKNKSEASPYKIYNLIPLNLQKYFIQGWIDADGCFYWNEKNKQRQFCLSGSYNQNWQIIEMLFNNMGIRYNIIRVNKKNKYSCVRITNKKDITILGNYIFSDVIVLKRKYDKFLKMIK